MTAHDEALTQGLLKILSTQINAARKNANKRITADWKVGDRNAAVLPDDTKIGSVTLAKGKTTASLTDEDAFMEWVLERHPDAIEQIQITRVNPDFTARMLAFARSTGSAVDPATGEAVPGIRVDEGEPHPMTILEDDAPDLVAKAWQDGALTEMLAKLMRPSLETGEQ